MENYTFQDFEKDLDNGYQIYLNYVNNQYLIYKTNENCYTQELINYDEKNPQPRMVVITKKRLNLHDGEKIRLQTGSDKYLEYHRNNIFCKMPTFELTDMDFKNKD